MGIYSREGNDLVVVGNGNATVYMDFFAQGEGKELPNLELPDGTVVSGKDFLQAQNPTIELASAAGPESQQRSEGSGSGEYQDGAGELLDGVSRLGSLGSDSWGRATDPQDSFNLTRLGVESPLGDVVDSAPAPNGDSDQNTDKDNGSAIGTDPSAPTDPVFPLVPTDPTDPEEGADAEEETNPGPVGPSLEYNARAVIYTRDNHSDQAADYTVRLSGVVVSGGVSFINAAMAAYFTLSVDAGGTLSISLTEEGLAQVRAAAEAAGQPNIYGYVSFVADGQEYTLQIVVNQSNSLSSQHENADPANDAGLAEGGLVHGEWHNGADFIADSNQIDTSGLGDQVVFSGGMVADGEVNNTINTHSADDAVASVSIGSEDSDTALYANYGGSNTIDGGTAGGKTNVIITAGDPDYARGMQAEHAGKNIIANAHNVDVIAKAHYGIGMHAATGGENSIDASGKATIGVTTGSSMAQGLNAEDGRNTIVADEGISITITSETLGIALQASGEKASNTLKTKGDIEVATNGAYYLQGITAMNGGTNTLEAGGNVTVNTADERGGYGSRGMSAVDGSNTINAGADVSLATDSTAIGISMMANGWNYDAVNSVNGANVTVETSGNTASGLEASGEKSQNRVTAAENVVIATSDINTDQDSIYSSATGMRAISGGLNHVEADGNISVLSSGPNTVTGMYTVAGGKNEINAKGDVSLASNTARGDAFGMKAEYAGKNSIHGDDVQISAMSSETGSAYGMNADCNGENTVAAEGNVDLAVEAHSSMAAAMLAMNGGRNILEAGRDISIETADVMGGYGSRILNATDGENVIKAGGAVRMNGQSTAYMVGMSADGNDVSRNSVEGQLVQLNVSGLGAKGMRVSGEKSENRITASGQVTLQVADYSEAASGIGATSMSAGYAGTNRIETQGDVLAHTVSAYDQSTGMYAVDEGKNGISANHANVYASSDSGNAKALHAEYAGKNTVNAQGYVGLSASSNTGSAVAIQANNGGMNSVSSAEVVSVNASSSSNAIGLRASGSTNEVAGDAGVYVNVTSNGGARGIQTVAANGQDAANTVNAGDFVNVYVSGQSSAHGITASSQKSATGNAVNEVTADGDARIYASAGAGYSFGLSAESNGAANPGQSFNRVQAGGRIEMGVMAQTSAYGISSTNGGKNTLDAGKGITMDVNAQGNAEAFFTQSSGSVATLHTLEGDIAVNVYGNGHTWGVMSSLGGANNLTAGKGDISIQANNSGRDGNMPHTGAVIAAASGTNTLNAENGAIRASAANHNAGNLATDITAAVYARDNGSNTLNAKSFEVEAAASSGQVYGLYANKGVNTLNGSDDSGVEVRIAVPAGQGAAAYAMYATGAGAVNHLVGSSKAQGGDVFRIEGDIAALNGGKNIITTGQGMNIIDLDGRVSVGGLALETENGYDILVLKAANLDELFTRFHDWLEQAASSFSIEKVDVLLSDDIYGATSLDSLSWLTDLFGVGIVDVLSYQDYMNMSMAAHEAAAFGMPAEGFDREYPDLFADDNGVHHTHNNDAADSFASHATAASADGAEYSHSRDVDALHDSGLVIDAIKAEAHLGGLLDGDVDPLSFNLAALAASNGVSDAGVTASGFEDSEFPLVLEDLVSAADSLDTALAGLSGDTVAEANDTPVHAVIGQLGDSIRLDEATVHMGETVVSDQSILDVQYSQDSIDTAQYMLIQNIISVTN